MYVLWFFATVLFLTVEVIVPHLVTLWFAIGSLVSLIAAGCGLGVEQQVALFFIVSIVLLISLRPVYVKYLKVKHVKTNVDVLIGQEGIVTSEIDNSQAVGLIKVMGQVWSAKSATSEKITIGTKVKVLKVEGVKLKVEKIQ